MADAGTTILAGTPAFTGFREVNCETVCNHCENIKRELEKTLLELSSVIYVIYGVKRLTRALMGYTDAHRYTPLNIRKRPL